VNPADAGETTTEPLDGTGRATVDVHGLLDRRRRDAGDHRRKRLAVVRLLIDPGRRNPFPCLLHPTYHMSENEWTECTIGGHTVEIRTRTDLEVERATELMDESNILADVLEELGPDDVFYDIGANVGLYTLFAAQRVDDVVAFEPHPKNLDSLETNLERNGVSATVVRGALSDRGGTVDLYVAADEAGAGTHTLAPDQVSDTTITVSSYVGDELIDAGEVPPPTVAKLDVQGAEYRVLKGLESALSDGSFRTIYCELHPEQIEAIGGSVDELRSLLESHGFEITRLVDKEDVTSNVKAVR